MLLVVTAQWVLPNALLLAVITPDGSAVRLMPLLRASDATGGKAATTVRIFFNATAPATGLSSAGHIDICSRMLTRTGRPVRDAPVCGAFEATRAMRDLTFCAM